ncbi:hypothetical protein Tco_0303434 [Tanacetum coccineum]
MTKGNGTGVRKPTWNNVQRVNKQNQFVPLAVQTRTGINPVNTVKASGTNYVSTARQKIDVRPIVNDVRPSNVFHKTHSPSSRPFKRSTVLKTNFSKQKVYTVKVKEVSTVREKWDTALDEEAGYTTNEESVRSKHEVIDPVRLANLGGATMSVKMDDMTQQETLGTVKSVLVKINKFEFPCDFVVTEYAWKFEEMIILEYHS